MSLEHKICLGAVTFNSENGQVARSWRPLCAVLRNLDFIPKERQLSNEVQGKLKESTKVTKRGGKEEQRTEETNRKQLAKWYT